MAEEEQGSESLKKEPEVNTARLEKIANAAAGAAQAKRWQARKNGMDDLGEASEVRNLNHDVEARAQAEAAMAQMMAKPKRKARW